MSMEKPKRPVSSPKETYAATSKESERDKSEGGDEPSNLI